MEGPQLGPVGDDITCPDQVAPRGRKASSTRKIKPQTSNLLWSPEEEEAEAVAEAGDGDGAEPTSEEEEALGVQLAEGGRETGGEQG